MTTQFANATYQEIIDLHTEENTVSVIGIHTPSTSLPIRMLSGFWRQFNKFRYNGCSFSMVPAARLPTDPLHVDANPGSATDIMDPRDNLNPVLFHGCHGNDMGRILNQFYETGSIALQNDTTGSVSNADTIRRGLTGDVKQTGASADIKVTQSTSLEFNEQSTNRVGDIQLESLYYRALTDTTWKKSGPQSGLKIRGLHPLVYSVATTRSLGNSGVYATTSPTADYGLYDGGSRTTTGGYPQVSGPSGSAGSVSSASEHDPIWALGSGPVQGPQMTSTESPYPVLHPDVYDTPFYTPKTQRLGWMDTRLRDSTSGTGTITGLNGQFLNDSRKMSDYFTEDKENFATVPKIFMGMLLLPRAYRTEQYYRCVLTHSFSFKGFRGQSFTGVCVGDVSNAPGYWNFN